MLSFIVHLVIHQKLENDQSSTKHFSFSDCSFLGKRWLSSSQFLATSILLSQKNTHTPPTLIPLLMSIFATYCTSVPRFLLFHPLFSASVRVVRCVLECLSVLLLILSRLGHTFCLLCVCVYIPSSSSSSS